jgi:hypothetical protein
MDAAEQALGREAQTEAGARLGRATALAALQADADIVGGVAAVVDHGGPDPVIAHEVGRGEQPGGVGRGHDDADVAQGVAGAAAIVDLPERARRRAAGRDLRAGADAIDRVDPELHHRACGVAGHLGGPEPTVGRGHDDRRRWTAVDREEQRDRRDAVGIVGVDRDRHRLAGGRHDRRVGEVAVGRAEVAGPRIGSPRVAGRDRDRQRGRAGQAVEVQAGVEQARAGLPARAQRDAVGAAVGDAVAARQRDLDVVVHVLGRAGRDQAQDVVARLLGILDHRAVAMVADPAKAGAAALEVAAGAQLGRRGRRVDHDPDVVDQDHAGVEQPEHQLVPDPVGADRARRRHRLVLDGLPAAGCALVAGRPGLGRVGRGALVEPHQGRAATVGGLGPAPAVVVGDLLDGIAAGVADDQPIAAVGQAAGEAAHDRRPDVAVARGEGRRVAGDDQVAVGGDLRPGRDLVADRVDELPAADVERRGAAIV